MRSNQTYAGIDNDKYGGMSPTGTIIRDAWVFGLIPETEKCVGWSPDRLQELYDKVSRAWEPYGHLVSKLPEELRARHQRVHNEAIERARQLGWAPELGDDD